MKNPDSDEPGFQWWFVVVVGWAQAAFLAALRRR